MAYFNVGCAVEDPAVVRRVEHEPFVDEADKFNTLMAELVRPVADVT
ncbi:MAG TPA: hypothetical protein VFO20_11565 [Propionibacteriaceae bacterium]|nr:hypothetical protein [Propionibacteriaceae bacterium]